MDEGESRKTPILFHSFWRPIRSFTRQATEERQEEEEIWGIGGFSIRHNKFEVPVGRVSTEVQRDPQNWSPKVTVPRVSPLRGCACLQGQADLITPHSATQ